jgi:hypothetical protein
MNSITIQDESLAVLIREKAEKEGLTFDETVEKLLCKGLGIRENGEGHQQDFVEFFGKWSAWELLEFNEQTKALNEVNAGDWA